MLNSWKTDTGNTSPNAPKEIDPISKPSTAAARAPTSLTGATPKSQSIVDECLTMRGDLESEADMLVKGKVLGNISCNILIVDMDALVEGGIDAKEVIVRGKVTGIIKADRVRLDGTANVECDIYQKTFSAEEGARIRGALKNMDELPDDLNIKTPAVKDKPRHNGSLKNAAPENA